MSVELHQIDAFTPKPFGGNPAAVVMLPQAAPVAWMQAVAAEMNLSETAFLVPTGAAYGLRWFTPTVEVDLCGHATLASAHALWETGRLSASDEARFDTRSGRLTCRRVGEWIEMDFPADPPHEVEPPEGLLPALGVKRAAFVGRDSFDYLVEVGSEFELRTIHPDLEALRAHGRRGVIVTAAGSGGYHFMSRFFAPAEGIGEDPVCGSAHCCLAPYWGEKLGLTEMLGYQASARGGVVRVRTVGDRVVLGGQAVTVLRGELLPPF